MQQSMLFQVRPERATDSAGRPSFQPPAQSSKCNAQTRICDACICVYVWGWVGVCCAGWGEGGGGVRNTVERRCCRATTYSACQCSLSHWCPVLLGCALWIACLLEQVEYPEIVDDIEPKHRFMSAYEQVRVPLCVRWCAASARLLAAHSCRPRRGRYVLWTKAQTFRS